MKDEEESGSKKNGVEREEGDLEVGKDELMSVEGNVQLHIYKLLLIFSFLTTPYLSHFIY